MVIHIFLHSAPPGHLSHFRISRVLHEPPAPWLNLAKLDPSQVDEIWNSYWIEMRCEPPHLRFARALPFTTHELRSLATRRQKMYWHPDCTLMNFRRAQAYHSQWIEPVRRVLMPQPLPQNPQHLLYGQIYPPPISSCHQADRDL